MITLCYIHVPGDADHYQKEDQFIRSYLAHPPGVEHQTVIICQGAEVVEGRRRVFDQLPNVRYVPRDGAGLDIGGYIDISPSIETEIMLCMGGSATVRRAGWMARMAESWKKHGPGFYGSLSSYQCRPHLNTTGFWCEPKLLTTYPNKVVTKPDRYEFEHGKNSMWWLANQMGMPTLLVTWDGEYDWLTWRKPDNISCRGDQSNCLTYFRINYNFDHYCAHDPVSRNNLMYLTDAHVTDPWFRDKLKGLTPLGEVVEG